MPGSLACRSLAPDLDSKTVPLTIFGPAPLVANGVGCVSANTFRAGTVAMRVAATAIRSRRERSALNVIFFLFFHVLAWLGPGVHFHAYVSLNCLKS
jgi:hypothetical protein